MLNASSLKEVLERPEVQMYMKGDKKQRLHIYVTAELNERIRKECEENGVTLVKYLLGHILSFDLSAMPERLQNALEKTNRLLIVSNVKANYRPRNQIGEFVTMAKVMNNEGVEIRTEQFHLRVTQECYNEIKRRAAMYSMSISDYVVFVLQHYDVAETSKKIDEINAKLDILLAQKEG